MNDGDFAHLDRWTADTTNFGIVLPDGWYGRPFDTAHWTKRLVRRGQRTALHIRGGIRLTFVACSGVHEIEDGRRIVIGPSERVRFEHRSRDPEFVPVTKDYEGESVTLVNQAPKHRYSDAWKTFRPEQYE